MTTPPELQERSATLLLVDLAGFSRLFRHRSNLEVAHFLHSFYQACEELITDQGGRIVKFMGDSCLAIFAGTAAADAVTSALKMELRVASDPLFYKWELKLGINIYCDQVIEGQLGGRYDLIGTGVNHLFQMGQGPGLRISEPVYRQLPSNRRTAWLKEAAPSTYNYRSS